MKKEKHHTLYYRLHTNKYLPNEVELLYRHEHLIEHLLFDRRSVNKRMFRDMWYELEAVYLKLKSGKRNFIIGHEMTGFQNIGKIYYYTYDFTDFLPDKVKIIIEDIHRALVQSAYRLD